jgi:hypothetical protein
VIIFEVISGDSGRRDRIEKVREYAAVPSIRRYVIPGGAGADWCARGVGGAAACEINEIPTGIPALQGSIFMPVGITTAVDIDRCKLVMPQPGE